METAGLASLSLMDKVHDIERELLPQNSAASVLSAIQEKTQDLSTTNSLDGSLPTVEQLTLTWPLFKKNRAILAGLFSIVGFISATIAVLSALCFVFGVRGFLLLFVSVEFVFWTFYKYLYYRLNLQPKRHEPPSHDGWDTFRRFLQMCAIQDDSGNAAVDVEAYVSLWFRGAAFSDVKRENMLDLLAYGFWYKSRKEMNEAGMEKVPEEMLSQFENQLGVKFQDGYNSKIAFMAHLWEDLNAVYRPLGFYILTELSGVLCGNILVAQGFQRKPLGKHYCQYTFPGASSFRKQTTFDSRRVPRRLSVTGKALPESKPIVFLHGVGLGVLPYLDFIASLVCTGHSLVVIEYRHVAMRLCTEVPSCQEVAATVITAMNTLDISDACFVAHSYGTFILSRIVKAYPERVHSCCFLDPVCLGMFMPQLLSMFVYQPARTDSIVNYIRDGVRLCVSRELGISTSMARRFAWTEVNLWPDDLPPNRSLVVFSGRDVLVPSGPVIDILSKSANKNEVKLMLHEELSHGEFMILSDWKIKIVNEISALASSEFKLSEDEIVGERAVRKKSLMLSLNAMQNVENTFVRKVDDVFLNGIRRTLSMPWNVQPTKLKKLNSEIKR